MTYTLPHWTDHRDSQWMGEDRQRTARTNVGPKQGVMACPGEQAMVRPRPESPPQYPGGRRRGTD